MEKRSKTNKEIFEEKYPLKKIMHNPVICAEAIGYLKALIQYFPSEENWADSIISDLLLIILFYTL
nr:MAG TPA: hypothetical protein [Caudoviricetes sp.]